MGSKFARQKKSFVFRDPSNRFIRRARFLLQNSESNPDRWGFSRQPLKKQFSSNHDPKHIMKSRIHAVHVASIVTLIGFFHGPEAQGATIVAGTVIGVDFAGTPDGNFNGVTSNGTITDLIATTGGTLTGVNLTTSGALTFNANADHTKTGQPSQFTTEHLTDWVVFNGGVTYTITLAGLVDSLTYNLVIGGANGSGFPVDTTWSVDGQSATTVAGTSSSTDGSGAFVSFTGLETDGLGNLVITGFKSSNYGVAAAFELTAVPEPGSLALLGLGGLLMAGSRRRRG